MGAARIAIYARVLTRKQDSASQEPDLRRWVDGQDGPVAWNRDTFTGRSMDRPAWNRLMQAVETGEVRTITVWRLDRLGRTAKGLSALFEELSRRRVNLISLRDGLDLSTPAGRLMANGLASVARYETEIRAERTLAGQAMARAKGVRFGRPRGPGKRLRVTAEQEATVRRLRAEGATVAVIASATGLCRPTVYSIINESPPRPRHAG